MFLDLHGVLVEIHLEHMKEFLDIVQTALEKKQQEFNLFIEKEAGKMNDDDRHWLDDRYSDDCWRLHEVLPELLYSNFIVSWHSFMEKKLFDLCDYLQLEKQLPSNHTDLPGRGIRNAHAYISKVAALPLIDSHWDELFNIGKIRNSIVHRDGDFRENDLIVLNPYLEKNKLLSDHKIPEFHPHLEYCRYLIEFGREFFTNLYYDAGKTVSRTSFFRK